MKTCDCTKDGYGICKHTGNDEDCKCAVDNLKKRIKK